MLEVLERCFPERLASEHWQQRLQALLPSYGEDPIADPAVLQSMRQRSNSLLGLQA